MKKAFSLLEILLALMLLSIIILLVSKPLQNFYIYFIDNERVNRQVYDMNLALIQIDKILQKCVQFKIVSNTYECLLKDKENVLLQRKNRIFIGTSGVVLKDENLSFYAPKSHFIYDEEYNLSTKDNESYKTVKSGVFKNQEDLYANNSSHKLLLYHLNNKQVYEANVFNQNYLSFTGSYFEGFFELLHAKALFELKNGYIIYKFLPTFKEDLNTQNAILLRNAKHFSIKDLQDFFEIKICISNTSKEFCLEKLSQK